MNSGLSEATNCGNSAEKNRMDLGFVKDTPNPWATSCQFLRSRRWVVAWPASLLIKASLLRQRFTPSHIR
ncbi:hypothetical protein D3C71_2030440 [compost metagenome]